MNYNKVIIGGNVTRDIELRYTPGGTEVCDLGLAINRTRKDDNGEKIEETTFIDVTLWGRTAEVAHQYSGKGKPLFVEGRLHLDSWDDKETGRKRTKLKVIGESVQLLNPRQESQQQAPQQPAQRRSMGQQAPSQGSAADETDDIPF